VDLALPCAVGVGSAIGVTLLGRVVGLDRDRAFYPTILIVIAILYDLFAVMGGSMNALLLESLVGFLFAASAVMGFKGSLWIVAAGLAGHGIFDLFHGHLIANPGVPPFWPAFCGSYDVAAGACLAWLLNRSHIKSRAA
jgi:hypothetical protein